MEIIETTSPNVYKFISQIAIIITNPTVKLWKFVGNEEEI